MFAHWFLKERKKAGSRKAVAEKLGVTPEQLKKVEEGEELPTAPFLARCVRAGMDVTYILTGQSAQSAPASRDEASLLFGWRSASAVMQAAVLTMLTLSAPAMPALRGSLHETRLVPMAQTVQTIQPPAPPLPANIHIHGRDAHIAINGSRVSRKG